MLVPQNGYLGFIRAAICRSGMRMRNKTDDQQEAYQDGGPTPMRSSLGPPSRILRLHQDTSRQVSDSVEARAATRIVLNQ